MVKEIVRYAQEYNAESQDVRKKWEELARKIQIKLHGEGTRIDLYHTRADEAYGEARSLLAVAGIKTKEEIAGKKILVLNSAPGLTVRIMSDLGADVVGIDTDEGMLRAGIEGGIATNEELRYAEPEGYLGSGGHRFDVVMGMRFIPDGDINMGRLVDSAVKSLNPGGSVVLSGDFYPGTFQQKPAGFSLEKSDVLAPQDTVRITPSV